MPAAGHWGRAAKEMGGLSDWPNWIHRLLWSAFAVLFIYLIGRFLTRTVCRQLTRWASQTRWKWDDALVQALNRGIPLWSLLFGVYVATGLWELSAPTLQFITRALYVLTWLSVTAVCAGFAGKLVVDYGGQFHDALPVTSLTENLVKIVIVILGALTILHGLGISVTPLLTALGVGGLAVALALQDTLSNLFSGFYLTVARNVRVGDYVKVESGPEGYVADIGWRATNIRMLPDNLVIVPNKKLAESIITNYYLPNRELAVTVDIGVDYTSDLDHVERVTSEVAREVMRTVQGGVPGFEPFIRYHALGDFSIQFTAIMRAKEFVDQYLIKHEFIKRLHVRYQQEGIKVPFPVSTVYSKTID